MGIAVLSLILAAAATGVLMSGVAPDLQGLLAIAGWAGVALLAVKDLVISGRRAVAPRPATHAPAPGPGTDHAAPHAPAHAPPHAPAHAHAPPPSPPGHGASGKHGGEFGRVTPHPAPPPPGLAAGLAAGAPGDFGRVSPPPPKAANAPEVPGTETVKAPLDQTAALGFRPLRGAVVLPGLAHAAEVKRKAGARGYIYCFEGPRKGEIVLLDTGKVTIGRAADNSLVIEEAGVSHHHATVQPRGKDYVIADHGSKNGTFVNDVRVTVTEKTLVSGDVLSIGSTKAYVQVS